MRKLVSLILMTIALLAAGLPLYGQNTVKVTGRVLDAADNQPLIGVGIVSSTGGGTITDEDGKYEISVPPTAELTFSALGYISKTEAVGGRTVINVTLETDMVALEEVVVLGYTSQKKNELSSAVVSLSSEKLNDVTTADLGNRLQGKVAGVVVMNASGQPGEGAQIRVRGTGSISANAGPLYVVDGIAGGSFNPNDVETLTVLKDASATALYGASAAGGVIVVTTKSAKSEETKINFKASAGIKRALMGHFSPMDGEEAYYLMKDIKPAATFGSEFPKALRDQNFNWMEAAFRTGIVQNYYGSATGRSGRTNYFASIDYYDEQGTLINTGFNRGSARVNLSTPLTDKVTLNLRLNYDRSKSRQTSSYVTLECAYRSLPWDNPYDENGNPIYMAGKTRTDNGERWWSHDGYNMFHNELYNYAYSTNESITGDVQLNWNILPWLTLTSSNRFASSNWDWEEYIDPRTNHPAYKKGHLSENSGFGTSFGTSNLLKAAKDFDNHSVNGIIGWEYGQSHNQTHGGSGTGMPAGQAALSNTAAESVNGYNYQSRAWALLAQAQYSYLGKYIATASIRYDETSRFAPKARGGFFPGASAAWIVSKEDFFSGISGFNLLKVRAGYGKTGNDSIEEFLYQDIYALSALYQNIVAAVMERQANPNLGWEEAYMASFGIDAELTRGINITVDLYDTKNDKILLNVPQATSTGFEKSMANVGTIRNRGVEFAIDADIIKNKDFLWNLGFNAGFNKNKVEYLPNGAFLQTAGTMTHQIKVGQDVFSWYMPKWVGVDPENGDPLWETIAADGTVSTTNDYTKATYQVCGVAAPLVGGGVNTTLRWKGFTLSANGNFFIGNKIYNATREIMDSDGAQLSSFYNQMSIYNGLGWSRWEQPGDIATHPKPGTAGNKNANAYSSRFLEDGSFFRLKNVTLSYNLPESILKKIKAKDIRVFASADNLFTLSRFSGTDPEVRLESTAWSLAGSFDMNYPVPMSIVGGVEITF